MKNMLEDSFSFFKLFGIVLCFFLSNLSVAEENLWTYTKGTDTRPEGSTEVKLMDVVRLGKDSGDYVFHDIRPEIEYGLTDRLTLGAELMIFHHDYSVEHPDLNPMYETQEANGGSFNKTQYAGFELAMKYNILSPYKDSVGLSLGLAFEDRNRYRLDGSQIDQFSYVVLLFLQKNWLDSTLTFALNWKTEFERRKADADRILEEEIAFDISAGLSYRFKPKHFVGFEVRTQSDYLNPSEEGVKESGYQSSNWDFSDLRLGSRHQYGIYAGPSYHYAEQRWWATIGILYQIQGGGSDRAFNRNGRNYDEHEEVHMSFIYGYEF